jgi:hypothetical protein
MNIHYTVGTEGYARVTTEQYRAKTGERKATKKGTRPARTRTGQAYPGGKWLRRAFAELGRRQNAHAATTSSMVKGRSVNPLAFQKPGSMKARAR